MSVLLPDRQLTVTVRAHPQERDDRGVPKPTPQDALTVRGPYPGAAEEQPDGSWTLRVDPRCWPMRPGDQITDGTLTWYASTQPQLRGVPGVPDVDFIRVIGTLDPPRTP